MARRIVIPIAIGEKFGRLTVLELLPSLPQNSNTRLRVRCDCGNEKIVLKTNVTKGVTKSCGCLRIDVSRKRLRKHGGCTKRTMTPEYKTWLGMKSRCTNPRYPDFFRYGGRGIFICDRWIGPDGFLNFRNDMGLKPSPLHSIDRINNDGPYSPENCRWATSPEQCRNRRSNRHLTFNGETKLLSDWAKTSGISMKRLHARLKRGWSIERALTTPVS